MSEFIDRLVAAMNAGDLEAAAALFRDDYHSEQPPHAERKFVAREQVRANWAAMFAGLGGFQVDLIRSVDDGRTTWTEWSWSGKRTDGEAFEIRGVGLFEVPNGLITLGRAYMEDIEDKEALIAREPANMPFDHPYY